MKLAENCKQWLKKYSYLPYLDGDKKEWDAFYHRFDAKFRGSTDAVKARLKTRYGERLQRLFKSINTGSKPILIDLGCGRGEMLDLAKSLGYHTLGVDASTAAYQTATLQGHDVELGDLLEFLQTQPNRSAAAITSLHVMQQNSAKYFWDVVRESHRVLQPGGVLLLETPSLYSLWVAARLFHLDPTHLQPVHPDYLAFLVGDAGFNPVEILEFDESKAEGRTLTTQNSASAMQDEFNRLDNWLMGPIDVACWAST